MDIDKNRIMILIVSNVQDAAIFAVENIQDVIEVMDTFDKEFIIDMLQVVIAKHHDLPEDMEDIYNRYEIPTKIRF
jgi:hypothetical protein